MIERPVVHARDHEHGGADPIRIEYEDVGGGGGTGGGGGIDFGIYPQTGSWLEVRTTGVNSTTNYGIDLRADGPSGSPGGIELFTNDTGEPGFSNEISMGQYSAYLVGIGIFSDAGMAITNTAGGTFNITQNSDSDPLSIRAQGGGGGVEIETSTVGDQINVNSADSITLSASNQATVYAASNMFLHTDAALNLTVVGQIVANLQNDANWDIDGDWKLKFLNNVESFKIYDSAGALVFQILGSGVIHGKTGGSIIWDL